MSNTAIIYRYQTLDSFQRGIYYTSLVDPLCELQDCAEYELPNWAELGENMDGIKLIYDSRGMVCDITAGKTAVTLRGSGGSVRLSGFASSSHFRTASFPCRRRAIKC